MEKFILTNIKEAMSEYPPKEFNYNEQHYTLLGPSNKMDLICPSDYIKSGQYIVTDERCNIYQALFAVNGVGTTYLIALRTNQLPDKKRVKKDDQE